MRYSSSVFPRAVLKPGVGLAVRVVGLGSEVPEFEPLFYIELTPGGVDSACHRCEIGEMSTSVLVIRALHQRHSRALSQ